MRHIRRYAAIAAGLIGTFAVFGATAPAFATLIPNSGNVDSPASPAAVVRTVVVGGMPGWQIALIAAGSALIAATATVIAYRAWQRRLAVMPA